MKAKHAWMIVAAVLLGGCEEKQETAAAEPRLKSSKRFRPDAPSVSPPEVLPPPVPSPSPAPPPEASPAVPPSAPVAPALSAEEREARRAEQRQQRIARVTEQMTARLKERDANGDGVLTENEFTGRMQRGFSRADTNGDGALDATEQEAMVRNLADRVANSDRGDRRGFARRGGDGFANGFRRRRDD